MAFCQCQVWALLDLLQDGLGKHTKAIDSKNYGLVSYYQIMPKSLL